MCTYSTDRVKGSVTYEIRGSHASYVWDPSPIHAVCWVTTRSHCARACLNVSAHACTYVRTCTRGAHACTCTLFIRISVYSMWTCTCEIDRRQRKMGRLDYSTRSWVVDLWQGNYRLRYIQAHLNEEGIEVSKKGLCLLIKKFKNTGTVADARRARRPCKQDQHYRFIDDAMAENDQLTSRQLHHWS